MYNYLYVYCAICDKMIVNDSFNCITWDQRGVVQGNFHGGFCSIMISISTLN